MHLANLDDRTALISDGGALDVEVARGGLFGPGIQSLYESWEKFLEWSAPTDSAATAVPIDRSKLLAPFPTLREVFAIGVNYRDHAEEAGLGVPEGVPLLPGDVIFTGTPGGVGLGRSSQRLIQPGETVRSWIEGIGEITQTFVVGE